MEGGSETGYKEMGATVVAALLKGGRAYIANLGDSRIYRLRKGRLTQLTKDHSVVYELLSKGRIESDEAMNHTAQGQITRYIGMEDKASPYVHTFVLEQGDRLLLCTDGLTDMVDDRKIARTLRDEAESQTVCEVLIGAANAAGGCDNVTVVIIDWLGG